MKKRISATFLFLFIVVGVFPGHATNSDGDQKKDTSKVYFFIKKELNTGAYFNGSNEREEVRTDETRQYEKNFTGSAGFKFETRIWNYLSYKQEFIDLTFDAGPFLGIGDWIDSTASWMIDGDRTIAGIRAKLAIDYTNRFYYDAKNYTLISINAWGRNDLFYQNIDGAAIDSVQSSSDLDEDGWDNKFRYGFQAKAGWGIGKLNPMNHYMVAEYLLNKYYKGRLFSSGETEGLANKITDLKLRRDPMIERDYEEELSEIVEFLRTSMLLANPGIPGTEWELGEFMPRLSGSRLELGPLFNYYNREPDFYYGGFVQYDNAKYVNVNRNRHFNVNLTYNHYKHHDWATLETNLGWTYYLDLKSQFGFGLKYNPGVVVHDWNDFEPVKHNFIPYLEYYTQVNSKTRMNFSFAWKLGDGEEFMLRGPEFSLAIYKSRY
jgi:hypothetical protein